MIQWFPAICSLGFLQVHQDFGAGNQWSTRTSKPSPHWSLQDCYSPPRGRDCWECVPLRTGLLWHISQAPEPCSKYQRSRLRSPPHPRPTPLRQASTPCRWLYLSQQPLHPPWWPSPLRSGWSGRCLILMRWRTSQDHHLRQWNTVYQLQLALTYSNYGRTKVRTKIEVLSCDVHIRTKMRSDSVSVSEEREGRIFQDSVSVSAFLWMHLTLLCVTTNWSQT